MRFFVFFLNRKQRLSKTQDARLMKEETAESFVRCIERLLFLSTGTNEDNVADDTEQALDSRLSHLLGTVLSRRVLRAQVSEANRLKEYKRVLGANTVREIADVCREIGRVKLERATIGCGNGVCTPGSTIRGKMPQTVRNLFFCTRLPDVWNCLANSVHCLTVQEWNELYVEAVQNLKMYREWMSQQRVQDVSATVSAVGQDV
jgi:hypothetical protein